MIDGMWWLVILLSIVIVLWLIAKLRGTKAPQYAQKDGTSEKSAPNDALQKTFMIIKKHLPDYRVTRKANHLLVTKQGEKIAMITIDKQLAPGQRLLGDVPVINYHRVPSRELITVHLKDTK